jgi:hypothetical protein
VARYPVGCFSGEYEIMFCHTLLFYFEGRFPFSDSYILYLIFYGLLLLDDEWQSSPMDKKTGAKAVKYALKITFRRIRKKKVKDPYIFKVLNHFKNLQS